MYMYMWSFEVYHTATDIHIFVNMGGGKEGRIDVERFQLFVPMDVIENILLRIPVKSLLRFRCVCKVWCCLIKSEDFINRHFHYKDNHESLLILKENGSCQRYFSIMFIDESSTEGEDLDYLQLPYYVDTISGPLSGIIALATEELERVALWNPATREFRPLPNPSINLPSYFKIAWKDLVLGLDPENNDFKVVCILRFEDVDTVESYYPCVIAVYSSIKNSWRCFEDVALVNADMHIVSPTIGNTYLNGVYYWMKYNLKEENSILAFDMGIDVLRQIELPKCLQSKHAELAPYNDSIALLSFLYETPIDVWLMEEKGHWTKIYTIQQSVSKEHLLYGFYEGNAILRHYFSDLMVLQNLKTQQIRNIGPNSRKMLWLANYKISLASVKQGLQDQEGHNSSISFHEFFRVPPWPPTIGENEHLRFMADIPSYPLDLPRYQRPY